MDIHIAQKRKRTTGDITRISSDGIHNFEEFLAAWKQLIDSPPDNDIKYQRIKKDIFHAFHMLILPLHHGLRGRREAQEDTRYRDPMKLMAAVQRSFPDHITDILFNYGLERCETTLTLKSSGNFQNAMMQCAQDHDLYKLGLTIAYYITI